MKNLKVVIKKSNKTQMVCGSNTQNFNKEWVATNPKDPFAGFYMYSFIHNGQLKEFKTIKKMKDFYLNTISSPVDFGVDVLGNEISDVLGLNF